VGVAYSCNKLALRTRLRNLNLRSHFSVFDSLRDIRVHIYDFLKFVGGLGAWQTFLGQSIGIDEKYCSSYSFRVLSVHTDRRTDAQTVRRTDGQTYRRTWLDRLR